MLTNRLLRGSLLLAGALALPSCGGDTSSPALLSSLGPHRSTARASQPLPFAWPPKRGEAYPNVEVLDHRGETVELSSFTGKVLLIEPIGMT